MKKSFVKAVSFFLALMMVVGVLPISVFASEATQSSMKLTVNSVTAQPGDTVAVTIDLSNNPGIASLKFEVSYDSALTLTNVEFGSAFGSYVTAPFPYKNPEPITFISPLSDITENGTLATLTFVVSEDVADNYVADICVSFDANDVYNGDFENIALDVENGSVTVFHGLPGDIDGDRVVNTKDAILLFRYVAGWDVTVDSGALDVNGDGLVNTKDAITLFRYVAGWDVEITRGSKVACQHTLIETPAKDATCVSEGNIAYWTCEKCGKIFVDSQAKIVVTLLDVTIAATSHRYTDGECVWCGIKENASSFTVTSVGVNKTLYKVGEAVVISAETNFDPSKVNLTASIFADGELVSSISGKGSLAYVPTLPGRYSIDLSVSDGSGMTYSYSLKSCFDVKASWVLEAVSVSSGSITLGEELTVTSTITGDASDLTYRFTIYKNGAVYNEIENATDGSLTFTPNTDGTYYVVLTAIDSYGEKMVAQTGNVEVVNTDDKNPILHVNHSNTLVIEELVGKGHGDILVAPGAVTLVWSREEQDESYKIDVDPYSNSIQTNDISVDVSGTSYTIPASVLAPGCEYDIRFRRINSAGKVIYSKHIYITVAGANTIKTEKKVEIISPPKNNETFAYGDVTIQWSKLNFASYYTLMLEYDCGIKKHEVFTIELTGNNNLFTLSASDLHRGCDHTLTLTAYDDFGNSEKVTRRFTMEGDPNIYEISTPVITSSEFYNKRASKSMSKYGDIVVTWDEIPAAEYYSIEIKCSRSNKYNPILTGTDHILTNSYTIPISALIDGYGYSVVVYAHHTDACCEKSDRMYFCAPYADGKMLYSPVLTTHDFSTDPKSPTAFINQDLTISWDAGSAATTYDVVYYLIEDEDIPAFEAKGITTNFVTIPKVKYPCSEGEYYVLEITANDENGMYQWTEFYVCPQKTAIERPQLTYPSLPVDKDDVLPCFNDDIRITWGSVSGAVSYRVKVYEYYDGDWDDIYEQNDLNDTSYVIPMDKLYMGGVFRTSITAIDQYGNIRKSERYYFQTGDSNYVGLTLDSWDAPYTAGHKYTWVQTVGKWTATVSNSWITISEASGNGQTRLMVTITENTSSFARSGNVTFRNENGGVAIFSINQAPNGSTNSGLVNITSPEQGSTVEKDTLTVKWTAKCDYSFFDLELKDLANGTIVFSEKRTTALYVQIPASKLQSGHTYQIILSIYNYSEVKSGERSIAFKIAGTSSGSGSGFDSGSSSGSGSGSGSESGSDGSEVTEEKVCEHANYIDSYVYTVYTNTIKTGSTHTYYHVYNRVCRDCGQDMGTVKGNTATGTHTIGSCGYCGCGYINTTGYTSWSATNQLSTTATVYSTPESTQKYGSISAGETVTVLGLCCGRYLIHYSLDNGSGVKQGYVTRNVLDTDEPRYTLYIDDPYMVDHTLIGLKGSYYQVRILDNYSKTYVSFGNSDFTCVSTETDVATIGASGTLVIKNSGSSSLVLSYKGEEVDRIVVCGCTPKSRTTNLAAISKQTDGIEVLGTLDIFNYKSTYVSDTRWEGGGYYKVTFDAYNSHPMVYGVAVYDMNDNVADTVLLEGFSTDFYKNIVNAFKYGLPEIFTGKVFTGETQSDKKKTSVSLEVPLGGYVRIVSMDDSQYVLYANIGELILSTISMGKEWTGVFGGTTPTNVVNFDSFVNELMETLGSTKFADKLLKKVISKGDVKDFIVDVLGLLADEGVTLGDLMETIEKCAKSMFKDSVKLCLTTIADLGLSTIPIASAIKNVTDAIVKTSELYMLVKDLTFWVNNDLMILAVRYPKEKI